MERASQRKLENLLRTEAGQRNLTKRIPQLGFFSWNANDVSCSEDPSSKGCIVKASLNIARVRQVKNHCTSRRFCQARWIEDLGLMDLDFVNLKFTYSSRFYNLDQIKTALDPSFLDIYEECCSSSVIFDRRRNRIPDEFALGQAVYNKVKQDEVHRTTRYYTFFMEQDAAQTFTDILFESGDSDNYYIVYVTDYFPSVRLRRFIAKLRETKKQKNRWMKSKDGMCIAKQLMQGLGQIHRLNFAHKYA